MKAIRNLLLTFSMIWSMAGQALEAAPPAWVLACSASARAVAQASFGRQPIFMGLVTDLVRDQQVGNGVRDVYMGIMDAKAGNGRPLCEACSRVDEVRNQVREVRLSNAPTNPPLRPYSDTDFKIFGTQAALGLHSIRHPDASPNEFVESAQIIRTNYDSLTVLVRIRSTSWYSSAVYEVDMLRNREMPVVATRIREDSLPSQYPQVSDPAIRMAASIGARSTAMATYSRQPIVRNFTTNIRGVSGWGDYSVEVEILDATAGSGVPLGLASVKVDGRANLVKEIRFQPSRTNPPLRQYSDIDFKIFATDAALALYSSRRPDAGRGISVNRAYRVGGQGYHDVYRVEIRDGESGNTMYFDVELARDREFPVLRITTNS